MKPIIKIYNFNTQETGTYTVYFQNPEPHGDVWLKRECSEACVNGMLNMRQKEDFFMGQFIFTVLESDIKDLMSSNPSEILRSRGEY